MAVTTFPIGGRARSLIAASLRRGMRFGLRPLMAARLPMQIRRQFFNTGMTMTRLFARSAKIEPTSCGGIPGEWVRVPETMSDPKAVIVYFFGGVHCAGTPKGHRSITTRLSYHTRLPVFCPAYRLAPENPFPAALEDALAIVRSIEPRSRVILAGHSSGCSLVLAAALSLRDAGGPWPLAQLLFYPWVDMTSQDPTPPEEALLSPALLRASVAALLGPRPKVISSDPLISPLLSDLRGLSPCLMQIGTYDMLLGQTLKLDAALERAGVISRCQIYDQLFHGYLSFGGILRSADEAMQRVPAFLDEVGSGERQADLQKRRSDAASPINL